MEKNDSAIPRSYILRISKEEWYRQVFSIKKYFPGVPRKWEPGGIIFLARKAEKGDSLVGYGVIREFVERDLLPEERRKECEMMGWRGAIVFSELYKISPPIPIKETILAASKARGRYFHGYTLTRDEVESLLRTIKKKASLIRV